MSEVTSFIPFTTDEVLNQLLTGLKHIGNPFEVKGVVRDFEPKVAEELEKYFEKTNIDFSVSEVDGYLIFKAAEN